MGFYCTKKRIPFIPFALKLVEKVLFPACDIPFTAEIGEGAYFPHRAIGVVIHSDAVIGKRVKIQANVVVGGRGGPGVPTIGDNVQIGTGSCILGEVKIGNNVVIVAGSVVLTDIPDGCTVIGVPAKIIKRTV